MHCDSGKIRFCSLFTLTSHVLHIIVCNSASVPGTYNVQAFLLLLVFRTSKYVLLITCLATVATLLWFYPTSI